MNDPDLGDIDEYQLVKWFFVSMVVWWLCEEVPIPHRWKDRLMVWWCGYTSRCGDKAFKGTPEGKQWAAKKRHLYLVRDK